MGNYDEGAQYRTGWALTGEPEHDLVVNTLLLLEQHVETSMGWNVEPALYLLSANADTVRVTIEEIAPQRWARGTAEEPGTALLEFARSFGGPRRWPARAFADMPAARCGFAFLDEYWSAATVRDHASPLARGRAVQGQVRTAPMAHVRRIAAADVGGRRYLVERKHGGAARHRTVDGLERAVVHEPIPTALWLLTAALASGHLEM